MFRNFSHSETTLFDPESIILAGKKKLKNRPIRYSYWKLNTERELKVIPRLSSNWTVSDNYIEGPIIIIARGFNTQDSVRSRQAPIDRFRAEESETVCDAAEYWTELSAPDQCQDCSSILLPTWRTPGDRSGSNPSIFDSQGLVRVASPAELYPGNPPDRQYLQQYNCDCFP